MEVKYHLYLPYIFIFGHEILKIAEKDGFCLSFETFNKLRNFGVLVRAGDQNSFNGALEPEYESGRPVFP
jgi:hypothetical protein